MKEINEELKKLIEENALAFATADESGNPHCIAVGDVRVVSENQILVTDNYMVETVKNIKKNPNVALTVWKEDGFELRGTAEYFNKGKWCEETKKIPENQDMPCKGAILITINKIKKLS
ncbi:pyridoxamine 5'-phosphate oxidase family protein [Candidatus Woesearchaeota archaeon]|nr:pyridoxamine 5'-phosphate oxidase family protein [Candidatus Woesearchaeota archaeon]